MSIIEKADQFAGLHQKRDPVVLYNIWNAGGARTLAEAGAKAIATGSWSVAAAHGYDDGEKIPLDLLLAVVERIMRSVDLPVSIDFEGGYAVEPASVADNVRRLLNVGAVGINFEDGVVQGSGLHPMDMQADRIRAIRAAAESEGVPLFINARTDVFLANPPETHASLLEEALQRGHIYAEAGASGFFVPGLKDPELVAKVCDAAALPVNVMMPGALDSIAKAAELGVSRVSYGPQPFVDANEDLSRRFSAL
ncbi:MAG: isocitrate lyase/phosphoenolpyruvate mutase family protein [Pseudomonadota bacterium]